MDNFVVNGSLVATSNAINTFDSHSMFSCLMRHITGDWGDLCDEDKELNNEALRHGGRLHSSYDVDNKKMWIITEADQSITTILLPEDY